MGKTGISFKKVKRVTLPNQCMSLREIIKRFVRHEALPVLQEGVYEDRFGDLEKLAKADITEQLEEADRLKNVVSDYVVSQKKKAAEEKAKAAAAAMPPVVVPPPVVPPTV